MGKISIINRIIFLLTGHLAGYMVVAGMEDFSDLTVLYYSIAFGVLLLSSLLIMLFGFEILKYNGVIVSAMLIPLSLSLGLINQYLPEIHYIYLIFGIIGMTAVLISIYYKYKKTKIIIISLVHGIPGMILVILPIFLVLKSIIQNHSIILVSVGALIISLAGILHTFLKIGKPIIPEQKFYKLFPLILFSATVFFVAGLRV